MSDDVFRGVRVHPKKSLYFAPQKNKNKIQKKSKISLKLFSLCFLFAQKKVFSLDRFLLTTKKKTAPSLSRCSRFHFKRTHLSSLRAQFREHTSSRAETSSLLFCVPSILRSVLREKRERERRESAVCGGCCVHHFDWKKEHTRR